MANDQTKIDAAMQCLTLAKQALRNRELERALKYTRKSMKYFPTNQARALLKQLQDIKARQAEHERKERPRQNPNQNTSFTPSQPEEKMDPEVKRILATKDYYELIGVPKDFTDKKQLTKLYRKLAMKYHPDRCRLAGAEDAFKYIARAYDVLNDPEKRRSYDIHGTDAPELQNHPRHFQEMHPEDIMRMFFGGGAFGGGFQRGGFRHGGFHTNFHPNQRQNQPREPDNPLSRLMSFLPILLILGYSFLSSATGDADPFSLDRSQDFTVRRTHSSEDITYYVDRSFGRRAQTRPNFLRNVEDMVEGKYLDKLVKECKAATKERNKRIKEASEVRGDRMVESLRSAYEYSLRSCELYDEYRASHGGT